MLRVAICDDNRLVRAAVRRLLELEPGIRCVSEATTGEDAVVLVQGTHVDVLVLDLSLPGMSGLDVIAVLRATVPHVRIVAFSACPAADCAAAVLSAGASAYLEKPVEPDKLIGAIQAAGSSPDT